VGAVALALHLRWRWDAVSLAQLVRVESVITERVLIADDRESEPREVEAEVLRGHLVRFEGRIYHHTHEVNGRWVYIPT